MRSKIIIICLLTVLTLTLIMGLAGFSSSKAFAQSIKPTEEGQKIPNPIRFDNIEDAIASIINIAYSLAGLVAVIYLVVGGYQYITSSGNPDAVEGAKATILNSIIGLIIILISYLLIHFILTQLGAGGLLPEAR